MMTLLPERVIARLAALAALTALVIIFHTAAAAQSGRKIPERPKPPEPVAEPSPTPVPRSEPEPLKPSYTLSVLNSPQMMTRTRFQYADRMPAWVAERLRTSALLAIRTGRASSRKDAVEVAKNSEETYVLFVTLAEDPFGSTDRFSSGVWIDYQVFAPVTGKIKTQGRAELRTEYLSISRVRRCDPVLSDADYLLQRASYEVAERVMSDLDLPVPSFRCQ